MKRSRFTQDQIIGILKEHQMGASAADLCRKRGISNATFYIWRSKYGGKAARARLLELAGEHRFGYWRLHILLDREGIAMNHKKLFRLYHEEGLSVRKRGGRKRALGTRSPMALPDGPNQHRSLDFVSNALNRRRRFRVLTVVDDYTLGRSSMLGGSTTTLRGPTPASVA